MTIAVLSNAQENHHMLNGLNGGDYKGKASSKNKQNSKKEVPEMSHAIAFSLAHLSRGIICFSYDRMLNDRICVKGSIGYCAARDYSNEWMTYYSNPDVSSGNNDDSYDYDTYVANNDFKQGFNYYTDVTVKLCTNLFEGPITREPALYRAYIGLSGRSYRCAYTPLFSQISAYNRTTIPIFFNGWNLQLGLNGYTNSGIFSDSYIGIGSINMSYPGYIKDNNSSFYNDHNRRDNTTRMMIVIGSTIGLHF